MLCDNQHEETIYAIYLLVCTYAITLTKICSGSYDLLIKILHYIDDLTGVLIILSVLNELDQNHKIPGLAEQLIIFPMNFINSMIIEHKC